MRRRSIIKSLAISALLTTVFSLQVEAREPMYEVHRTADPTAGSHVALRLGAADCDAATSQFDLDINNVRAKLLNGGDFWWNLSSAKYEVPKVDQDKPGQVSVHSLFAGAIWISGEDEGGNLKLAAQTYRSNGNDFWPGPLDRAGRIDHATCKQYDKHFNVYGSEIKQFQDDFSKSSGTLAESKIPKNILKWPGKGNPFLTADGLYYGDDLAPFRDVDDNGIYDPTKGDYPVINAHPDSSCGANSYQFADQMIFWVFNDVGNVHSQTQGDAIGLQINAIAFAFKTADELNSMTFYRYNIKNKSNTSLRKTYMGQWVDPDLGCFNNDYVGCDTIRAMGVVYNGAVTDPDCQSRGYGNEVPLLGIDYFEGPKADAGDGIDNNHNGVIDESGELLGLTGFVYFNNAAGPQGDPRNAAQYRNYMTGKWSDGNPITYGGTGRGGTQPVNFVYPGDPSNALQWSECNNQTSGANPTDDRRFLQVSGPFTVKPGDENNITVGVIWVRPKVGAYPCPSFSKYLGPADDKAQALFNNCFKVLRGPDAPSMLIRELDKEIILNIVNKTTSNNAGEAYNEVDPIIKILPGADTLDASYHFQGYKLYQLKDGSVSTSDIGDNTKARLLAQVDVKDGVVNLVNYDFDDNVNSLVPSLKVEAGDKGITHSFDIKSDLFAEGDGKLINHKTYYFTSVAYGYNQYQAPDPLRPSDGGQLHPYLQGNGNLEVYTAIPHISTPRNEGTTLNAAWGDSIAVTRIQGQGNGGIDLMLSEKSISGILTSADGKLDILEYRPGSGPLNIKVTDPMKLSNSDYRVVFADDTMDGNRIAYSGKWVLINKTTGDSVWAERDLSRPNEQIITKTTTGTTDPEAWGFSINIGQSRPVYAKDYQSGLGTSVGAVYGIMNSAITFVDKDHKWLSFVADEGQNAVSNWIRSGEFKAAATGGTANPLAGIYDDHYKTVGGVDIFHDKKEYFEKILGGTWSPYCLATNYANPLNKPTSAAPEKLAFMHGPGFKWDDFTKNTPPQNTLDSLQSVLIVLTPDKSKWTRCIVFETGEEAQLNQLNTFINRQGVLNSVYTGSYNSHKGEIRTDWSRDTLGRLHGVDPALLGDPDTGRSWFPGYAINLETGERLNMAFGEASNLADQNGTDMLWNPTSDKLTQLNEVLYGGKHFIYVFKTPYDAGANYQSIMLRNFNNYTGASSSLRTRVPASFAQVYRDIMWTCIPYITPGFKLLDIKDGLIPSELRIRLSVDKPYERYITSETPNPDSLNVYEFSTKGMAPADNDVKVAKSALDLINVVPNPYYAYGGFYESSPVDTKVKITNLPNKCTVTIYTLDGTLIKQYERNIQTPYTATNPDISDGIVKGDVVNQENSLEWDLKNFKNIPISSGVYLIHIYAPGIGERTLKWFGALRPTDVDSF